jgi:hypothetical protein
MGRSYNRNNEDLVDQEKALGQSPSSENLLARECKPLFTIIRLNSSDPHLFAKS